MSEALLVLIPLGSSCAFLAIVLAIVEWRDRVATRRAQEEWIARAKRRKPGQPGPQYPIRLKPLSEAQRREIEERGR